MSKTSSISYLATFFCYLIIIASVSSILSINRSLARSANISTLQAKNILDGFDYIEGVVIFENHKFTINGIIINPKKYQLAVVGLNPETFSGYTLRGFQKRSNALAAITGGFRSSQNLPLGLVVVNGKIDNRVVEKPPAINGILTISNDKIDIISYIDYRESFNIEHALQSGPIILKKGGINAISKEVKETESPYSRSFIAIQNSGDIVFAVTSSVYLYDLAEFLRDTSDDGLNCDVALNLEGRGGEGLLINTEDFNESFGNVLVRRPNAIIVKHLSQLRLTVLADIQKGINLFKRGAFNDAFKVLIEHNDQIEAQYYLGVMLMGRRTGEQDQERAIEYLTEAANSRYAKAQAYLGYLYETGTGLPKDLERALDMYKRAAKGGNARAQFNLALAYREGNVVERNDEIAVKWLEKASECYLPAKNNLAYMLQRGLGTEKDIPRAIELYTEAANANFGQAQYNLAIVYLTGNGVEQNLVEAYKWLELAARNQHLDALEKRDYIFELMKPEDTKKAEEMVLNFHPNPAPNCSDN